MALPSQYTYLEKEPAPKILKEALALYGTIEAPGEANNPTIIAWARELGETTRAVYTADSVPWCGLFMGVVAQRAGFPPPKNLLWALSWSAWGAPVASPMLGDVLVFTRSNGGHVGLYVGEDREHYHVLGGNQKDAVSIVKIRKTRLYCARRCLWKVQQPRSIRKIVVSSSGVGMVPVSSNEV